MPVSKEEAGRAERRQAVPRVSYELGSAAALVKFASAQPEPVAAALHARMGGEHRELLDLFRRHGAQVAAQA